MRSRVGLLFTCLFLVSSCAGESTTTSETTETLPTTTATTAAAATGTTDAEHGFWVSEAVQATSDSLVARLGVDQAPVAVVLALDHGYSMAQLMEAHDALNADGSIAGIDPQHEPFGLLAGDAENATAAGRLGVAWGGADVLAAPLLFTDEPLDDDPGYTAEEVIADVQKLLRTMFPTYGEDEAEERRIKEGKRVLHVLFGLAALGYSLDQIVDGIAFGDTALLKPRDKKAALCIGLVELRSDGTRRVIRPAGEPTRWAGSACQPLLDEIGKGRDGKFTTLVPDASGSRDIDGVTDPISPPPTTAVVGFPRTYEGTITREQTYTARFGAERSHTAVNDDHFEVTLLADGTVRGVYTKGGNGSVFECSDPNLKGEIYPGTSEAEVYSLDSWTHRDGDIYRTDEALIGTYDTEVMDLSLLSYTMGIGPIEGCFEGTFFLEEFYVEATIPRISPP